MRTVIAEPHHLPVPQRGFVVIHRRVDWEPVEYMAHHRTGVKR